MDGPRRITFVTSPARCNLRCGICRDHSPLADAGPDRAELSLDLVRGVVEQQLGHGLSEIIPSTRGEPLLWPALPALVSWCEQAGVLVNVTTNGTFPRLGPTRWAELLARAASDVKISWNGATAATAEPLMEGLRFDAAVEAVRELAAARDARRARGERACTVSFQVTARESNVAELPDIVRLAIALGIDRVKVNQLQVHFPALEVEDLRRSPASRARWNAAVREAHAVVRNAQEVAGAPPPAEHGLRSRDGAHFVATGRSRRHAADGRLEQPPSRRPLQLVNVVEMEEDPAAAPLGPCPFLGREAWILQDGCFAPCPAPAGLDGRMGSFGSVRDLPLADIWAGDAYRDLVSGYASRAECAACPMRRAGGL